MKNKCDCYQKRTYKSVNGERDFIKYECWGTKERDECSCGGDRTKCDFYPEVREKAEEDSLIIDEDSLIVTYDCYTPDMATLCVVRKEGNKIKVLHTIQGDAALKIYKELTGK